MLGWDILRGKDKGLVKVIHQPYREESAFGVVRSAFEKLPQAKDAVFDLAMSFDMPRLDHGNRVAARVQRRLKDKVPYVAHPYGQVLGDALNDPSHPPDPRPDYRGLRESGMFSGVQWQMTAELAYHRGTLSRYPIKTIQDTVDVMRAMDLGVSPGTPITAQAER